MCFCIALFQILPPPLPSSIYCPLLNVSLSCISLVDTKFPPLISLLSSPFLSLCHFFFLFLTVPTTIFYFSSTIFCLPLILHFSRHLRASVLCQPTLSQPPPYQVIVVTVSPPPPLTGDLHMPSTEAISIQHQSSLVTRYHSLLHHQQYLEDS